LSHPQKIEVFARQNHSAPNLVPEMSRTEKAGIHPAGQEGDAVDLAN
jgi:hypothetical protein